MRVHRGLEHHRDDNDILLKHEAKVFKFMEEEEERKVDSSRSSDS